MTVKDRLSEMRLMQNANGSNAGDRESTEQHEVDIAYQEAANIRELIQEICDKTARVNEILKAYTLKLPKSAEEEIDSLFSTTTSTAYKINGRLKDFQQKLNALRKKRSNSTEFRIRKVQFLSLKESFSEALSESSKSLEYHKNSRKELLKKSLQIVKGDVSEDELETLLDENKFSSFTDNILVTTQEARLQLADIEERHNDLIKIENQLQETLDLFIKLATLVEQQQESVDRVEFHAQSATEAVEQGTSDLEKGAIKKRKAFKRKIYILLIAIIVLLVVILIIVI